MTRSPSRTRRLGVLVLCLVLAAVRARMRHRQAVDPDRRGLPDLRATRRASPGRSSQGVQIAADLVNADGGIAGRRDRARGPRPALARRGRRRDGRPGGAGHPDRDRRVLVRPVDRRERGGRSGRAPVLGGGRRRRSADRAGPADGLPRGRPRARPSAPTRRCFAARGARRSARQDRLGAARRDRGRRRRVRARPSPTRRRRPRSIAGCRSSSGASYNLHLPDWPAVMADLAAARPDVIILASHIPDGIAFRQAMLDVRPPGRRAHRLDDGRVRPRLRRRARARCDRDLRLGSPDRRASSHRRSDPRPPPRTRDSPTAAGRDAAAG